MISENRNLLVPHRALAIGGVVLILMTMALGFVYASYVSHVANGAIKQAWASVMEAVVLADTEIVKQQFSVIAELTEKRGRIMNSHSHLGAFGLLALAVAALLPLSSLGVKARNAVALFILAGSVLQFAGVIFSYLITTVSLYVSDVGSALLLIGVALVIYGFLNKKKQFGGGEMMNTIRHNLSSGSSLLLLKGGGLLLLSCMLLGIYIAWLLVDSDQPGMLNALSDSVVSLLNHDVAAAQQAIADFKSLQSKMAINAAAHSHGMEMGFLTLLLAINRNAIAISERYFRPWCMLFIMVSFCFPLFIFLAINYSFIFAKFANYSGVTLGIMLVVALYGLTMKAKVKDIDRSICEERNG